MDWSAKRRLSANDFKGNLERRKLVLGKDIGCKWLFYFKLLRYSESWVCLVHLRSAKKLERLRAFEWFHDVLKRKSKELATSARLASHSTFGILLADLRFFLLRELSLCFGKSMPHSPQMGSASRPPSCALRDASFFNCDFAPSLIHSSNPGPRNFTAHGGLECLKEVAACTAWNAVRAGSVVDKHRGNFNFKACLSTC